MALRNTPVNSKLNGNEVNSNRKGYFTPNSIAPKLTFANSVSSSSSISKKKSEPKSNLLDKNLDGSSCESIFNNAFSLPSSASKVIPHSTSSKLIKQKTSLNACHTPSSLYRNCTPKSKFTATPIKSSGKKRITNLVKTPECFSKVSIDPLSATKSNVKLSSQHTENLQKDCEASNLVVAVRVRPLNSTECLNPNVINCIQVDENEITVIAGTTADTTCGVRHSFQYDHAFWSCNNEDPQYADQEMVFQGTGLPLIKKAFDGYNACLFAYGQTGSGKSFSMLGIENYDNDDILVNSEIGIIPRFCQEIFNRIEKNKNKIRPEIEVSYFEIYNEKIHDLLSVGNTNEGLTNNPHLKNALKVREHPIYGPYIVDLSTHPVDSYHSLRNWLAVGNSQRATAATGMNDKSSRSHSIFNIVLNLSEIDTENNLCKTALKQTKRSKISLVDLAGSERISHKGSCGERIKEGVSINKSLLTLGKVISALAESKKNSTIFVPYRDSVLTWLLRENLGGNSKTVMLATISPASIHVDETLATLRYACQARTIVNRVKVNEDPHDKIIRELRAEVERLQALRQDYERQKRHSASDHLPPRKIIIERSVDESEVEALRIQLSETEKELEKAQKSWMDRLKEAEDLRKTEMKLLKRKGLALEISVEQKQACLINLAADPLLSGTLFYIIPEGVVQIGRARPLAFLQPDIVLEGPLVAFQHCSIENSYGKLYLTPESDEFETYLNGELIKDRKQMFHGDRLVIGGSHYFRISNPNCTKKNNKMVDYELAHREILQKQEEQLRRELEKEKKFALAQIELERAANEENYNERIEILELEKFRYKCTKELLETEQKVLEERNWNTHKFEYTPYKSTLLEDIKRMMEHPSEENLHNIQIKVKEATQRCRALGCNYDFKQSQVVDECGIFRPVILIIDNVNRQKAEWPTARLDVWLDIIRDSNNITKENIFTSVDVNWKEFTQFDNLDSTLNDSLNSSKISLNLSAVKEVILREPNIQTIRNMFFSNNEERNNIKRNLSVIDSPKIKSTKKVLTYDDDDVPKSPRTKPSTSNDNNFSTLAYGYLKDLQRSTLKLKKLCKHFQNQEKQNDKTNVYNNFAKTVDQIENSVYDLQATLNEQKLTASPTKTPKSVRFLID